MITSPVRSILFLFNAAVLGVAVIAPTSARAAQLDRNGDGISDVWATLYPTAGAPTADPDGDGVANLAEAQAGTDPTSPASRLVATAAIDTSGNLRVRWASIAGKHYLLESSTDLITWAPLPGEYAGTGAELSGIVRPAGTVSGIRTFWHVVVFDMDSAGSGLNDWEKTHPEAYAQIDIAAPTNGAVSPSGNTFVAKGDSLTIAITPNPGYVVRNVLVDGVDMGAITTYTFSKVTTAHSISVGFQSATTPPAPFTGGFYQLTARHSGKVLDVSGNSYAQGANVLLIVAEVMAW